MSIKNIENISDMDDYEIRKYISNNDDDFFDYVITDFINPPPIIKIYYNIIQNHFIVCDKYLKYGKLLGYFKDINTTNWNIQLEWIDNKYEHFLSIFDCAKGGVPIYVKLMELVISKFNNDCIAKIIRENIYERLLVLIEIIPKEIFLSLKLNKLWLPQA